jgi:hypothetical protein
MSRKLESSIHMAVKSCLARCRLSQTPLAALAEFAEKLRDLGWDWESVHQVEKGVLFSLMGQTSETQRKTEPA